MTDFAQADEVYDALRRLVDALGGAKEVGHRLRPDRDWQFARNWLLNCLNPEHAQELHPTQVVTLLRWASEAGYHDCKHWIDAATDYAPSAPLSHDVALTEAVKVAKAKKREAEESVKHLQELIDLAKNPKLLATMQHAGLKLP